MSLAQLVDRVESENARQHRLGRLRQSFRVKKINLQENVHQRRHQFQQLQQDIKRQASNRISRIKKVPRWLTILKRSYHLYGGKHLMLIVILVLYNFLGAIIFYWSENSADEDLETAWRQQLTKDRGKFVAERLIPSIFNNSHYLFYLNPVQTRQITNLFETQLTGYETNLNISYTRSKIKWDFWNAMLYAQTICTTIGYGHLYPSTDRGRVLTMLYAIVGIPLVFSVLSDLGRLLTKCLKYPWYLLKCGCRRTFQYCTKQSMEEIRRLDAEDKKAIAVFDLPIPVAIILVILWIFVCSATFTIWEEEWTYLTAFYFFFISLSTIGLGDITPSQPKYLLMMFGYIVIGLSLVSMCINLIQSKLERTYDAGKDDLSEHYSTQIGDDPPYRPSGNNTSRQFSSGRAVHAGLATVDRITLGIFQRSSSHSLSGRTAAPEQNVTNTTVHQNRLDRPGVTTTSCSTQTLLSFPSPRHKMRTGLTLHRGKVVPTSLSIDDVMRIVDTDEGDMVILTELSRDLSVEQDQCCEQAPPHFIDSDHSIIEIDDRFASSDDDEEDNQNLTSVLNPNAVSSQSQHNRDLYDIEEMEEREDRLLLQAPSCSHSVSSPGVHNSTNQHQASCSHYRSRLSIISERTNTATPGPGGHTTAGSDSRSASSASCSQSAARSPPTPLEATVKFGRACKLHQSISEPIGFHQSILPSEFDYREIDEQSGLIDDYPEEEGPTPRSTQNSLDQVFHYLRNRAMPNSKRKKNTTNL